MGFAERKQFRDKLEENAVRFTRPRVNVLSMAMIIGGSYKWEKSTVQMECKQHA